MGGRTHWLGPLVARTVEVASGWGIGWIVLAPAEPGGIDSPARRGFKRLAHVRKANFEVFLGAPEACQDSD
jgi:hypothetical protein